MMRSFPPAFALVIGCLGVLPIAAQQVKPTLEVRTTTGQTTFHMGERIALKLILTAPDNKKYSIDTTNYDRSGRLDIDTFEVTPATGWTDPLAQYFSQGAFMGGGLRGSEILSSKPVSFAADLNEHIRFDEPGTYTVTATSHRVGTVGKYLFLEAPYLSLRSNSIEIRIISATAEWQAVKLRSILEDLVASPRQTENKIPSDKRTAAVADLRFLNSPAAIDMLASYLREDTNDNQLMWAAALGLSGVPNPLRDGALNAMSRQLDDPAFPVSDFFLTIMAQLEGGPEGPSTESGFVPRRGARFKMVWQLALTELVGKQGAALASTAETLLTDAPDGEPTEIKAQIAASVAKSFTALPIDRQISELEYNWGELSRQPMLPVLQALIHQSPPEVGSPFYSAADLDAMVLKRWFELDPDGAVREVAVLLASPNAALSPHSVELLPGGPQPQFETMWAAELGKSEDSNRETLLAALLVRFGTGSATVQIETKIKSLVGKWACAPQAAALAYIVKFNSDNAGDLVEQAMTATHDTGCYETLFSSVSAYAHGTALNDAAVRDLRNANPRAAADAAEYLRYFGTESSKQPLLERYREWNERWASKPDEVDPATVAGYPMSLFGQSLGEAIIANQGWLADSKLITEVLSRCIGEQMCMELQHLSSEASALTQNVSVSNSAANENYRIGQYDSKSLELFDAKLAQYPAGTKFRLIPTSPQSSDQIKLEKEAEALFSKHGMTLEGAAPAAATNASAR